MRSRMSESINQICQLSNHVHALSIEIHIKFTKIKSKMHKVKSISMTLNQFFLCRIPNEMYSNKSIPCLK